ncbi:MAG TPA: Fe-S protein assembly co-chaperone HscB [Candidatus Methylomirabilis sp.]|nr:Fe-S protein assembly co-chaperone HscB [Candidatus Methylomirabilis sp.]
MNDYFEVFDLPRNLQVDLEALQRTFYALSRRYHPDFHPTAAASEQMLVLERSALLNRAYRALREPLSRLAHLISLEQGREEGPVKPKAPMDLLEEMLEVQEALEEAKGSGLDGQATQRLQEERQALMDRQAAGDAAIVDRFAEWDRARDAGHDTRPLLAWFEQALATRAYLRTVIDDLSDALGEEQPSHVSHRRH